MGRAGHDDDIDLRIEKVAENVFSTGELLELYSLLTLLCEYLTGAKKTLTCESGWYYHRQDPILVRPRDFENAFSHWRRWF